MTTLHNITKAQREALLNFLLEARVKGTRVSKEGSNFNVSPPPEPDARTRSLILSQYRTAPNLIAYIDIYTEEVDELILALINTYAYRYLPEAFGEMLDVIGEIVGVKREIAGATPLGLFGFYQDAGSLGHSDATDTDATGGVLYAHGERSSGDLKLTDEELRRQIEARILINSVTPTIEALYQYTDILYGSVSDAWQLTEGTATTNMHFSGDLSLQERTFFSAVYLNFKVAGVDLTLSDNSGNINLLQ